MYKDSLNDKHKIVSNKAVKLALTVILAGVTSMSLTACGGEKASLVDNSEIVSHEEGKINELDSIVESDGEEESNEPIEEYTGNRYENQFLGLRLRYPENWFTSDSYDVLLNVMKDLGVNDKLDLTKVKLNDILNIVTFESNDSYLNTIDIVAIPSLDKISGDISESTATQEQDSKTDSTKNATNTDKKEASKNTSKDSPKTDTTADKETAKNSSTTGNEVKGLPKFTESDLKAIKDNVILSMGGEDNVISCEEPYIAEINGKEVALIEFTTTIYNQELSMVSAFINLGENYLMITSASLNEPNEVDKIYNIEDIIMTLELGFDLPKIETQVLAPIKSQTDEEVLKDLTSEIEGNEDETSSVNISN